MFDLEISERADLPEAIKLLSKVEPWNYFSVNKSLEDAIYTVY